MRNFYKTQSETLQAARVRPGHVQAIPDYVPSLTAELRDAVRGEVRFDAGSRALYATDASNYRQVPIGVVIPRDAHQAYPEHPRKTGPADRLFSDGRKEAE